MAATEEQVLRAIAILSGMAKKPSVEDAAERLGEEREFEDLNDDDLQAIARAALPRLTGAAAKAPPPLSRSTFPAAGGAASKAVPRTLDLDLLAAPYRFVALNDIVAMPSQPAHHSLPLPDHVSARIVVDWAAETPILVGSEKDGMAMPMTLDGKDAFIIPGATFRGMIRAATEIVAQARLSGGNLGFRYGLRDFDHPVYADQSPVSKSESVKAGWLTCSGDPEEPDTLWTLEPLGDQWALMAIDDIKANWRVRQDWKMSALADKYASVGMRQGETFDFTRTFGIGPVSSETLPARTGGTYKRRTVKPGGSGSGVLVCSDKVTSPSSNKAYDYVFFGTPGPGVVLDPDVVKTFRRLYSTPSKNNPVPSGSYEKLLPTMKAGKRVAVFYVGNPDPNAEDAGFFFGLTRLFKVPYKNSVRDVLLKGHPNHAQTAEAVGDKLLYRADFVENLFGYVIEADELAAAMPPGSNREAAKSAALKGRVAFSVGKLADTSAAAQRTKSFTAAMLAPRASFAPFYLGGGENGRDYGADKPKLAGRKRYLPRGTWSFADMTRMADRQKASLKSELKVSEKIFSSMMFLEAARGADGKAAELTFTSEIRLHNVSPAELGAVLFAITHGGDPDKHFRHMIGHGKPFGAGQLRVARARLVVSLNNGAAVLEAAGPEIVSADGSKGFCPMPTPHLPSHSHRPFLTAFVAHMRRHKGLEQFPLDRTGKLIEGLAEFFGSARRDAASAAKPSPAVNPAYDYLALNDVETRKSQFKAIRDAVKPDRKHSLPAEPKRDRLMAAPKVTDIKTSW